MRLISSMTRERYNELSPTGKIGISIPLPVATEDSNVNPEYFIDEKPNKLTRANSFMILDEVFIIRKKDYQGKASRLYHIFRQSDGRLVTSVPMTDKDKVISLVTRKYIEKVM